MKKLLAILMLLCLLMPAYAELPDGLELNPEGWFWTGIVEGGFSFLLPNDTYSWELTDVQQAAGILLVAGNDDFTLQVRRFEPEQLTLDQMAEILENEPTADTEILDMDGSTVIRYRNTGASATSELYGVVFNGMDGKLYKISFFTGVDEDFSPEAPVWEIAAYIADSLMVVDFSDWPIAEEAAA